MAPEQDLEVTRHLRDHLTDGRWHDDCYYCRQRRCYGGTGVPERKCPDDGTCHHNCIPTKCFRVEFAGPLSGVYPDNQWPADVLTTFARGL